MIESRTNPFKFLDSFTKEDKDIYFGRESETEDLYELLQQTDLVLLYGETGTGKTSLVNCGLAQRFDDTDWLPIYIRRNQNINDSLLETLADSLTNSKADITSITNLLKELYWEHLLPVHIIFDQLEELFILGEIEEQKLFIDNLKLILEEDSDTKVILVFREEYLAHLNAFERQIPRLFDKRLRIEAIRETKALEVITKTCSITDIELEDTKRTPRQILDIITEEGRAEISLPYLQVLLFKLYDRAKTQASKVILFDQKLIQLVGSLGNVLTRFLEEQIIRIEKKIGDKSTAWIFLKFFITPDGTKKPVSRTELYESIGRIIQQREKIDFCLNYFTNTHILRPLDKGQFELTHDSIAAKIHRAKMHQKLDIPLIEGNPYKGLTPYEASDKSIFFGRDRVARATHNILGSQSLLIITGASGSGKSSLVRAGLIPKLQEEGYLIFPEIRPGRTPLVGLDSILRQIKEAGNSSKGYIIIVDQYEELITRTEKEEDRNTFALTLKQLIEKPDSLIPQLDDSRVKIIITVRLDFEPQLETLALKEHWRDARYIIPLLTSAELIDIVEKPAYLAAVSFEPEGLINEMVAEVQGSTGSLPLLSFALSLLFERCKDIGRIITEEDYRSIGGIIGSLKTHADEIYASLESPLQNTVRSIMLRMVSLEGAEFASRRVYMNELVFDQPIENARIQQGLDILIEQRLIVKGLDLTISSTPYVEPAHDALIWGWGTLWGWINAYGKDNIFLHDRLRSQVKLYESSNRDKRYLWHNDPRLEQAHSKLTLNSEEKEFLEASIKKKKRASSRIRFLIGGVITLLLLSTLLAISFGLQETENRREVERSRNTLDEQNEEISKLLDDLKYRSNQLEIALARSDSLTKVAILSRDAMEAAKTLAEFNETLAIKGEKDVRNLLDSLQEINYSLITARDSTDQVMKQLASSLDALQGAKDRLVEGLLVEVEQLISQLHYDSAIVKLEEIIDLGLGKNPLAVCHGFMETAYFAIESGSTSKAIQLTAQAANTIKKFEIADEVRSIATVKDARVQILIALKNLDAKFYSTLIGRYYPEMIRIEGGEYIFTLRNNQDTTILLQDFFLAKTETTVWQYALFHFSITGKSFLEKEPSMKLSQGNLPVKKVSWYDAIRYANWINLQRGVDSVYTFKRSLSEDNWEVVRRKIVGAYYLPLEEEWEYAAKGGILRDSFLAVNSDSTAQIPWYTSDVPGSSSLENPLGLLEMTGSLPEWCENWYDRNREANQQARGRVIRGGGDFRTASYKIRFRSSEAPHLRLDNGFRLARWP